MIAVSNDELNTLKKISCWARQIVETENNIKIRMNAAADFILVVECKTKGRKTDPKIALQL
jgi:hypothetical protein